MNKIYKTLIIILVIINAIFLFKFVVKKFKKKSINSNLIIGISPDYPPFSYIENEQIVGFDIDLIKIISFNMKKNIKIKEMAFSSLIPSLQANKIDLIISGVSNSSKRKSSNIDFSYPYYNSKFAIITNSKNFIKKINDFNAKSSIGVQTGTTMENFIKKYKEYYNLQFNIVSLDLNTLLIAKLKQNEIDALIVEDIQAPSFIKNALDFNYKPIENNLFINVKKNNYVICVNKGSVLIDEINKNINIARNDIDKLLIKWYLK